MIRHTLHLGLMALALSAFSLSAMAAECCHKDQEKTPTSHCTRNASTCKGAMVCPHKIQTTSKAACCKNHRLYESRGNGR